MLAKLVAEHVTITEDDGILLVGFFSNPEHAKYVMLSRQMDDPECKDPDSRMVHVERDDQRWSSYGGISQCILSRGLLKVQLTPAGRRELGCDEVKVTFKADVVPLEALGIALQRLFEFDLDRFHATTFSK
jgi:hypothetical protein